MQYTFFDPITGEIKLTFSGETLAEMQALYPDLQVIEGIHDGKMLYVNPQTLEILTRPDNTLIVNKTTCVANGVDEIIISNLPIPSIIDIRGEISDVITVTDGEFYFTTQEPGYYKFIVKSFPVQDKQLTIVAE